MLLDSTTKSFCTPPDSGRPRSSLLQSKCVDLSYLFRPNPPMGVPLLPCFGRNLLNRPMPQYVAFLRGINLGKRRVKMDHLRDLFEKMGFTAVSTYIASGNVLFSSTSRSSSKLEVLIEKELESALGYAVPTLVRTQAAVVLVVKNAPLGDLFTDGLKPSTQITFFKQPIEPELEQTFASLRTPTDAFAVGDQTLY